MISKQQHKAIGRLILIVCGSLAVAAVIISLITLIYPLFVDWAHARDAIALPVNPGGMPATASPSTPPSGADGGAGNSLGYSAPPASSPSSPDTQSAPPPPTAGSFTELFSGLGWSDPSSTAYEDYSATAISLVPDFAVTSTDAAVPSFTPPDDGLTGTVTQTSSGYVATVPAYPNLSITSPYQGILRFGYDSDTKNVLVVYAAYMSRVFEIAPDGTVRDDSSRFGQRAFGGTGVGDLAVQPVIFARDGVWWISSGPGSTEPKIMKLSGGSVIDYTAAFPGAGAVLQVAPGPDAHTVYVNDGSRSYILYDNGFKPMPVEWISTRLNDWNGTIIAGTITNLVASDSGSGSGTGGIQYFLSNDDGVTWTPAASGVRTPFPNPGGAIRFKIVLMPSSDRYVSPWVDTFGITYEIQRQ